MQFPYDPHAPTGWQLHKIKPGERPHGNRAFEELWNAALDLPDISLTLDRLAWSFFQDAQPSYLDDEGWDAADERFLSWAIFAYRSHGETLAERALASLAPGEPDRLVMHRQLVQTHSAIFRVLDVRRNIGMTLRDVSNGKTFSVFDRSATRGLTRDSGVVGMLLRISDSEWIPAPGICIYRTLPDAAIDDDQDAQDPFFALSLESHGFGASADWMLDVPLEHFPDVYEAFAETLAATGADVPAYAALQREIQQADSPSDVMARFASREWWTPVELNVVLAFIARAWNSTPRDEFGGKSPDEMAAAPQGVRAERAKTRRRRR